MLNWNEGSSSLFYTMKKSLSVLLSFFILPLSAQTVDYSVVDVPMEIELEMTKITDYKDNVCLPEVIRSKGNLSWFSNRIIDLSPDGTQLAYLSYRNNTSNIYVLNLDSPNVSTQRTNRQMVLDFTYSPDGKNIVFSEKVGNDVNVFQTDASKGYVCRQITSGASDYSPIFSSDQSNIFFARQEKNGVSIWSYEMQSRNLLSYSLGLNPYPIPNSSSYLCTRPNSIDRTEIWRIDYSSGIEECVASAPWKGFSTPSLSPDGRWILMVGESEIKTEEFTYRNTDIYVCRPDGTDLMQLTFHAADDLSPTWSKDGKYIYFISQRGSADGTANIWRMKFIHN